MVSHGRNAFWPTPSPGIEVRKTANKPWVLTPSGLVTYTVRVQNTFADRVGHAELDERHPARVARRRGHLCAAPVHPDRRDRTAARCPRPIAGAASTDVSGTVTATATPATGADVTDTDTSTVQILASAPVFRARVVVGPGQVVFPGETVRFSVTLMNLDLERTATLTSLTSPQFRDLRIPASAGCRWSLGPTGSSTATSTGSSVARWAPNQRSPSPDRRPTTRAR